MTTCTIYDEGLLVGTGDLVNGATTVTSWVADGGWESTANPRAAARKNVQIAVGTLGVFNTRILTDGGTTLTLKDACPFTAAA